VITGLLPGLLSGLVLAGANAEPEPGRDNGLLTAEEVTYLKLSGCELVVLSACETGLGRPEGGEGMMGLRRSFRQAGARSVISSLWKVRDAETSELMTRLYENLWLKKMGNLEALREAQIWMLDRNRKEYGGDARPSTWGAFVLDGEWE
jgi:CHAT domain-containing protein